MLFLSVHIIVDSYLYRITLIMYINISARFSSGIKLLY
jgi:hypothetical protein